MIDKSKTYRTRDDREVRIYATDGWDNRIHGAIKSEDGWRIHSWCNDGRWLFGEESPCDLIEVRPRHKRTVWLNVIKDACGDIQFSTYQYKQQADRHHYDRRLACIKVDLDFEEGEGL